MVSISLLYNSKYLLFLSTLSILKKWKKNYFYEYFLAYLFFDTLTLIFSFYLFLIPGIRSVPLFTLSGEPLEFAALLVEVTVVNSSNEDLQSIMHEISRLSAERDELVRRIVRQSKKGSVEMREVVIFSIVIYRYQCCNE